VLAILTLEFIQRKDWQTAFGKEGNFTSMLTNNHQVYHAPKKIVGHFDM